MVDFNLYLFALITYVLIALTVGYLFVRGTYWMVQLIFGRVLAILSSTVVGILFLISIIVFISFVNKSLEAPVSFNE